MLGTQAQGLACLRNPVLAQATSIPESCQMDRPGFCVRDLWIVQPGTETKLLSCRVAHEANTQTREWARMAARCPVRAWAEGYSIAGGGNLDEVCWQSCDLTGAPRIRDPKGEWEGNGSEMANY